MTFSQIQSFIVAAECGNISKAADTLYITQPTLSRNITAMEKELDVTLFHRTARGIEPTPAGDIFYQTAVNIMEEYKSAQVRLKEFSFSGQKGLTLTTIPGTYSFLTKTVELFLLNNPGVQISTHENEQDEILTSINEFSVDAGFLWSDLIPPTGYRVLPTIPAKMALIVAIGHPLAACDEISLSQASSHTFIIPTQSAVRKLIFGLCASEGFTPKMVVNVSLVGTMIDLVRRGKGVAIIYDIPDITYEGIHIIRLSNTPPTSLALVMHEHNSSPLAKRFETFLSKINPVELF